MKRAIVPAGLGDLGRLAASRVERAFVLGVTLGVVIGVGAALLSAAFGWWIRL